MIAKTTEDSRPQNGSRYGNRRLTILVIVICCGVLFYYLSVFLRKEHIKQRVTHDLSDGLWIYHCMLDFESDFGAFPGPQSAKKDARFTNFTSPHSNRYLAQLIKGEYGVTEDSFYIGGSKHCSRGKVDHVITPDEKILQRGENGWSYIMMTFPENGIENRGLRALSTCDPNLPLLMASTAGAGNELKFDQKLYDGKMILISVNGQSKQFDIGTSKIIMIPPALNRLFQSGEDTLWGNTSYKIFHPE